MSGKTQKKIDSVLQYFKEEFPGCLFRSRHPGIEDPMWRFIVACEDDSYTIAFTENVWDKHDASSLYSYLKRISLAKVLKKSPDKHVQITK